MTTPQNLFNDEGFLDRLSRLIGRDCEYLGHHCRLVEILRDQDLLVLEHRETVPPIQTDQYGQASFRGNDVIQVPIHGQDNDSFSDQMLELFTCLSACEKSQADAASSIDSTVA